MPNIKPSREHNNLNTFHTALSRRGLEFKIQLKDSSNMVVLKIHAIITVAGLVRWDWNEYVRRFE